MTAEGIVRSDRKTIKKKRVLKPGSDEPKEEGKVDETPLEEQVRNTPLPICLDIALHQFTSFQKDANKELLEQAHDKKIRIKRTKVLREDHESGTDEEEVPAETVDYQKPKPKSLDEVKLKKTQPRQKPKEPEKKISVSLKHHQFEALPLDEEVRLGHL